MTQEPLPEGFSGYNVGMFIDAYAIIVQQDGDGGDSLQREGMYAFGKWMRFDLDSKSFQFEELPQRRDPARIMARFEVEPGLYVRHPDPNRWYSNPKTTSRDQIVPLLAYCAAYEDYPRLWRFFVATAQRGFFMPNTVRAGDGKTGWKMPDSLLGHLSLFIRAGGHYTDALYPLLLITDSVKLAGTLLNLIPIHWEQTNRRLRLKLPKDSDDNNAIIAHLLAARFKPTPISWLDRQIYALTRRLNYGNVLMGEEHPVMASLVWYHRAENRGNPEMAELYRPLVEKYFSPLGRRPHAAHQLTRAYWGKYLGQGGRAPASL